MSTSLTDDWMAKVKQISSGLMDVILGKAEDLPKKILDQSAQYEHLLIRLVAENERLKVCLEVFKSGANAVVATPLPVPLALAIRATRVTGPVVLLKIIFNNIPYTNTT